MGHLSSILCSHKRHIYCAHTSDTSITAQTNTAYHKMGHLIGAAKRWDISAAYCAHTSNTSNSTNKHSLSQDGSSDRSKRWDISAAYCANTRKHLTAQTNTAYHKMGPSHQKMAAYCAHTSNTSNTQHITRWAAYCAHTPNTDTATSITSSLSQDVGAAKANRSLQSDVPYSTLNGVGATNHNTLSPLHAQDTSVL